MWERGSRLVGHVTVCEMDGCFEDLDVIFCYIELREGYEVE